MNNTKPFVAPTHSAETHGHKAFIHPLDQSVTVHSKSEHDGSLTLIGTGRWENGIIRGSGVNCGILVLLERDLRAKTGTP